MDRMKEALSGGGNTQQSPSPNTSSLTPQLAATKAILEKSFLPHRKGLHREYTSLGHRLEKPILKNWLEVVREDGTTPVTGLEVKGAYTAGLAAKKGAVHAKDSIDFVLVVKDPSSIVPEELKAWGFEAKGRVTSRTAAVEEQNLHMFPHLRIHDSEVFDEVRDQGE